MLRFETVLGVVFLSFALLVSGQSGGVQVNHGLVGYGINPNLPSCAFACQAVLQSSQLECSTPEVMDNMPMGSMVMSMTFMTDPSCYATDDSYLQSLALCIHENCQAIQVWQLEQFWAMYGVGQADPQPSPKESYQEALFKAGNSSTINLIFGEPLNQTSRVSDSDYQLYYGTLSVFWWVEVRHSMTA